MSNAHRLPRGVVPSHYALVFTPDLAVGHFEGTADIDATMHEPTSVISMNALDLDILTQDHGAESCGVVECYQVQSSVVGMVLRARAKITSHFWHPSLGQLHPPKSSI